MDLPPASYLFLISGTMMALPILRRAAASDAVRRQVTGLVAGLFVVESGLALLYYSKVVCWLLVAIGITLGTWFTVGTNRRGRSAVVALVGLTAGVVFQSLADPIGFLFYFSTALPLLVLLPVAFFVARVLAFARTPTTVLGSALAIMYPGWFVFSAYARDFLVSFEIMHLPILALTVVGLALLSGPGMREAHKGRRRSGEGLGLEGEPGHPWVPVIVAAFGVVFAGAVWSAGQTAAFGPTLALGLIATLVALVASLWARHTRILTTAASGVLMVAALTATLALANTAYGPSGPGHPRLDLLGGYALVVTVSMWVLVMQWFGIGYRRATLAQFHDTGSMATSTLEVVAARLAPNAPRFDATPDLDRARLQAYADTLRSDGREAGLVVIQAPRDPLWTLGDDAYAYLEEENDPAAYLHVAVVEPDAVHVLPPVLPEDRLE